jgi:hypothetical protein
MSILGGFARMFINKSQTGANNLIGERLAKMRKAMGLSQKKICRSAAASLLGYRQKCDPTDRMR